MAMLQQLTLPRGATSAAGSPRLLPPLPPCMRMAREARRRAGPWGCGGRTGRSKGRRRTWPRRRTGEGEGAAAGRRREPCRSGRSRRMGRRRQRRRQRRRRRPRRRRRRRRRRRARRREEGEEEGLSWLRGRRGGRGRRRRPRRRRRRRRCRWRWGRSWTQILLLLLRPKWRWDQPMPTAAALPKLPPTATKTRIRAGVTWCLFFTNLNTRTNKNKIMSYLLTAISILPAAEIRHIVFLWLITCALESGKLKYLFLLKWRWDFRARRRLPSD